MADTKENLIKLLCEAKSKSADDAWFSDTTYAEQLAMEADHLIANGVTVQQWIPVTERLPEVIDSYLVVVKYKYDFEKAYTIDTDVATYDPCGSGYIDNCWNTYTDWDEGQQYLHVTHWMPLPEPPKD